MGKVTKSKMVLKQCPDCFQQVPVASKLCRCGHVFFSKKLMNTKTTEDDGVKRRRTERVRRERPDYYSASEFENHLRRISTSSKEKGASGEGSPKKKKTKRGRPKGSQNKTKDGANSDQKDKEREEDLYSNLPTDKAFVYAVVLAEINEKIQNQWKAPDKQEEGQPSASSSSLEDKVTEETS